MFKDKVIYRGTGRRKSSIAQVILTPGSGLITVNGKPALEFFPYATLVQDLEQPLVATNTLKDFDIIVKVIGGGFTGQAGATRLGIARALLQASEDYRKLLRDQGLLTRDARIKERKKYGLRGARRAPQYSKR
ncbi:30S ribosomal protein S9 [Mycoplasma capricolum subsp. capripneumoniae]|uniref:Small ribosomal subunit protein uS9 n=7 Tax=Mycoplasma mycoides group TaxID=656088 RepID=Q6MSQ7_MYCMS|nr:MULTISPECIES: 30S ribosomal protein S9 [Mycoplasma mycoides group]CAE77331.1 30S RIBOSOMAL PROTEIN S9 [Mycoplasma mycoides subsp. mycoides SC str. PG1]ABC01381.1 30S ribosomal protein S9 [Mycoplasma capricolum subsp. capricolum ATCC 27343]ADK70068.1 ribosomal protein S9 [Mycoplasma mycoides subsp. mycoides SC str. Gladysdale]ADR24224.1 ribosomal protein S9 [Mycoplasma leachii PG50]AIZ55571.1 30S ribosomal protein S9 [Mycoplasma mycoides subsp. mycoides]